MEKDYKISIIRILSMLSIVLCHIFQAKDMIIAFWINVAVQVFLFMSGFLYGRKNINSPIPWIKKQYKKILIPYYIYIIVILIIYFIFARYTLTIKNIMSLALNLQLIYNAPKGLGHFWFIPVILICYLITPLLQRILKSDEKLGKKEIFLLILIICLVEIMFLQKWISIGICNIICYILGYLISYLSDNNKKQKKIILFGIILLAIISNYIKIFLNPYKYSIFIRIIMQILIKNAHILLGSAIFIILYTALKNVKKLLTPITLKIIDSIDEHCFYIYITHHVFILGPFSLMNLTSSLIINILIIILCIIISSCLLRNITRLVHKAIEGIKDKSNNRIS